MRRLITLDTLPPGSQGVVTAVREGVLYQRLLALGFVPGTVVTALRRAPFGNPVAYLVRGYCLALRRQEAATILVEEIG